MKRFEIKKYLFLLVIIFPVVAILSGGSVKYLANIASTGVMNEYSDRVENFRDEGVISSENMELLKRGEAEYLKSLKESGYSEKKFYLDYFFVPLTVLFFSLLWCALGWFTAGFDLRYEIIGFAVSSILLLFFGFSYQPFVHVTFYFFGIFLRKKHWGISQAKI